MSCCESNNQPCGAESSHDEVYDSVKEYYGKVLKKTQDLKTNACTTCGKPPKFLQEVISLIHEDIENRYYGCGLIVPPFLEGMRILDLGSGSGRDCFILSKLVGENGFVLGVDMTKEQIDLANSFVDYHTQKFKYTKPNIKFVQGYIEKLGELGISDSSFDIIVYVLANLAHNSSSNCVVNLSPDKESVLKEAFRVLKPGGEFYFSDVYSDRRIPKHLMENDILYGECLSGALYWNDFLNLAKKVGFHDPRLVEDSPICIRNPDIEQLIGHIKFFSATYRLFKVAGLEPACEDYGQAVIYNGGVPTMPNEFKLDGHHIIPKGKVFPVCGNTFNILKHSRFSPFFVFIGSTDCHYGRFGACSPFTPSTNQVSNSASPCCT